MKSNPVALLGLTVLAGCFAGLLAVAPARAQDTPARTQDAPVRTQTPLSGRRTLLPIARCRPTC